MPSNLPAKPSKDEYGPAMAKLEPLERVFVHLLFEGAKPTDALRKAGYDAPSEPALRKQASRLMRRPAIGDAMLEECKSRKKDMLPELDRQLVSIIKNKGHKDHLKALKTGYAMAGVVEVQQRDIHVTVSQVSQKEKLDSIRLWAKELGLDPAKLLGVNSLDDLGTIDAEFTEVIESKPEDF
jgi:hypothetical protein